MIERTISMDRKYNPNDFEYPLNEYMEEAYKAVSLKNKALPQKLQQV